MIKVIVHNELNADFIDLINVYKNFLDLLYYIL